MFADIIVVFGLILVVCFGAVLLVGAPFLPTLQPQIKTALDLLNLRPGETMLELGCGDGRVLLAAAQRGWLAVGYELNPFVALVAWLRTRKYRKQVRVVWGDYWRADWPKADGVFVFLLARYMSKLDKKIIQYSHKPLALVSFAFHIPNREPAAQKDGVFLYLYK